jgi:hypothetical protein
VASGEEERFIGRRAIACNIILEKITNQFYESVTELKLRVTPKSPKSDYELEAIAAWVVAMKRRHPASLVWMPISPTVFTLFDT